MVLRNIYRTLLQDSSSAASSAEAMVDERVAKAIIDFDDPEIVFDLRNTNGCPHCDLIFMILSGKNFKHILTRLLLRGDILMYYTCLLLFLYAI